jgi:hypothetical protein
VMVQMLRMVLCRIGRCKKGPEDAGSVSRRRPNW